MSLRAREVAREILRSSSGKFGTGFFLALVAVSIFVISTYPLDFGLRFWSNPGFWADNPKAVPPAWTGAVSGIRKAEHTSFTAPKATEILDRGGSRVWVYTFRFQYEFDEHPTFTSFTINDLVFYDRPPVITLFLTRPDGKLELYKHFVPGGGPGEQEPIRRYSEAPFRVHLSGERSVAFGIANFMMEKYGLSLSQTALLTRGVDRVLFGIPERGNAESSPVLKGTYEVRVEASLHDPRDSIGMVKFVLGGSVFGLMGTDFLGRDLALGLLFGFPVALFIGLVTSTVVTLIGSFMGIFSGYAGGKTDTAIQRTSDILSNLPLLPLLIFLTFILGQKLYVVIGILIVFGWPGMTILIRSMVLQIKSSQFVEAAVSLGGSRSHIMVRHIFPQTAPFVFAQLIFSTPGAILAEAALSFLGLGDPSIPTWGQILEAGFRNGGVYTGFWWWILPPGFLIVLTALTFVLVALAMEPVVNPRLRRMR